METSEQLDKLAGALSKAQSEIIGAVKDATNPFFKSKYADLASCWDAVRGPLTSNGLSIVQTPTTGEDGAVTVTTRLLHSSGQWLEDSMSCKPAKSDAQAMGSVISYLRRYSLSAVCGLAQIDDDGNAAAGKSEPDKDAKTSMEPVKKAAKKSGKKETAPQTIPVGTNNADETDWTGWANRYEKSIDYAPDLPWLNAQIKKNAVPYDNFIAEHSESALYFENIIGAKRGSFDTSPFEGD